MWNVECGMWNVECGKWKVESGKWKWGRLITESRIRRRGIASDRFRGSGARKGELSGSERVNKMTSIEGAISNQQ